MIRKTIAAAITVVALTWVAVSARQAAQPLPGPGSGIVPIRGIVEVSNVPTVNAYQQGEWRVAVASAPDIRVSAMPGVSVLPPDFLKRGARYTITWPVGEVERITISQLGGGNWVKVDLPGGRGRWINLAVARSLEETP